jgi:DNA repair photolyase
MAKFIETQCKSFLNRLNENLFTIRTYSIRLSGNPYSGCQFDCAYCYAAYVHKFNPGVTPEEFGHTIFVKLNAPDVLASELQRDYVNRQKLIREYVDLGTITDGYQPIERKYELTRRCLQTFLRYEFPVTALTKSNLCLRDLDLWQLLSEKGLGVIGFTITRPTTIRHDIKHFLEPNSPSTQIMLNTLHEFVRAGVKTFVFMDPVVPFLSAERENVTQLIREVAATGNKKVFFGVLKLNPLSWGLFKRRLMQYDKTLIPQFEELYLRDGMKEFGRSWVPSYAYRRDLYKFARDQCQANGMGFSCEGGFYDLWLDDWASVEDPYRHPSGYNLWEIVRAREGEPVTLAELKRELEARFSTLTKAYLLQLGALWYERRLFVELPDIAAMEIGGDLVYFYVASGM